MTSDLPSPQPPPRAFTQGVGTVFQFTGVLMFLGFFFACCFSALLSKDTAMRSDWNTMGWGTYTGQQGLSIAMVVGVGLGLALASIGLGLQAQRRKSPTFAVVTCGFGSLFWLVHALFFAFALRSIALSLVALVLLALFIALLALSIGAYREMLADPPPPGFELLPQDYKIPYSHMHQDPPEVRLAKELETRRQKLEIQQKELEMLEQKLHRKLKDPPK